MSSPQTQSQKPLNGTNQPVLPPNVLIFSPVESDSAQALLNGRIFTRLTVSSTIHPSALAAALRDDQQIQINENFSICHRNVVLIFDAESEGKDLQDVHHEHFRTVCLALKRHDIGLDVAGCVFDAPNVIQAGFQLDELSSGAILVIDIMDGENEDHDDDGDDDDSGSEEGADARVEGFQVDNQSRISMS